MFQQSDPMRQQPAMKNKNKNLAVISNLYITKKKLSCTDSKEFKSLDCYWR